MAGEGGEGEGEGGQKGGDGEEGGEAGRKKGGGGSTGTGTSVDEWGGTEDFCACRVPQTAPRREQELRRNASQSAKPSQNPAHGGSAGAQAPQQQHQGGGGGSEEESQRGGGGGGNALTSNASLSSEYGLAGAPSGQVRRRAFPSLFAGGVACGGCGCVRLGGCAQRRPGAAPHFPIGSCGYGSRRLGVGEATGGISSLLRAPARVAGCQQVDDEDAYGGYASHAHGTKRGRDEDGEEGHDGAGGDEGNGEGGGSLMTPGWVNVCRGRGKGGARRRRRRRGRR